MLTGFAAELRAAPWANALAALLDAAARDPGLAGFQARLVDQHAGALGAAVPAGIDRGELPADTDPDEATSQQP